MRILVAPTSFKGSLSPGEAASAIADGLRAGFPACELTQTPLADGGEGTLQVLLNALDGQSKRVSVDDPLGRPVNAEIGLFPDGVAFVESAQAAGLPLLGDDERDPMRASTFGVGRMIQAALDVGAGEIWIGLGGSATVDGGLGMLRALGAKLLDADGRDVPPGGQGLSQLASIDSSTLDDRLAGTTLKALCDVDSVLLGSQGTQFYMRQKGATAEQCAKLTNALSRFAELTERECERDVRNILGAGAAGGLGAALAFLGADLVSGSQFVMNALEVDRKLASCDLVVTGEGQIDEQTWNGKTICVLAERARAHACPVVALCGGYSGNLENLQSQGIDAVFSIVPGPVSLENALAHADRHLAEAAQNLGIVLRASRMPPRPFN